MDDVAGAGCPSRRVPEVVLHIASAGGNLPLNVLELTEDCVGVLTDDVGEDVQSAAMGHAEDKFVELLLTRLLDHQREQRDEAFRALERETLGADVFLLDELFEDDGVRQVSEDLDLLVA